MNKTVRSLYVGLAGKALNVDEFERRCFDNMFMFRTVNESTIAFGKFKNRIDSYDAK